VGERRFRVQRVWRAADGLNLGEVSWLEPEPQIRLPDEYAQFGATVRRALDELAEHYQHVEKKFDDAAWIGARISELLPIGLNDKQLLLELDDPIARLDALLSIVPIEK
jgi:Lon protease-like protein